ncbi:PrsW family intramembrane metalloprotease [Agrococcus sp. SGAir0287]|uniref:PrsW family intramembrane metalloprotease n=1 Tax=Agrococcus sp. SGAir0287 TaxID=2070347 RepID=UPI0010CD3B2F|nr:PrsW family intramembrane metalloprotease [Agrococcus sp. SGAir0287]QCR19635.1 PrsW family intramembrane metalloprotease [Agrococcus sp. SGAir0287]
MTLAQPPQTPQQPGYQPPVQQGAPQQQIPPMPALSKPPATGLVLGIVGVAALAIMSVVTLLMLAVVFGLGAAVPIAGFLGLFPLGFVVWALLGLDRWEPEPRIALWLSVLWGGTMAVLLTLALNELVLQPLFAFPILSTPVLADAIYGILAPAFPALRDLVELGGYSTADAVYQFYGPVIQAPFTEELWKAIPVVVMFLFVRRHFDGPIDGFVIAGFSAAGFAFTENILYFGRELSEAGDASFIFFLRGIMSPLAHVIFTAVGVGLALGFAARRSSRLWILVALPVGLGVSMFLHALWNSASFWVPAGMLGFFIYYGLVQVPICIGALLLVVMLRRFEARLTRLRLDEYAQAGWFSHEEARLLSSSDGRLSLTQWARRKGIGKAMQAYIRIATRLAANRQRAIIGREKLRPVADEARLLGDVSALRSYMATVGSGAAVQVGAGQRLPEPMQGSTPQTQRFAPAPGAQAQPWQQGWQYAMAVGGSSPAQPGAAAPGAQRPPAQPPQQPGGQQGW